MELTILFCSVAIESAGEVSEPEDCVLPTHHEGSHILTTSTTVSSKESETSSSDGRREEQLTLAGFDTIRFKNNFLEVANVFQ